MFEPHFLGISIIVVLPKISQQVLRFDCFPGRPEQPGGRRQRTADMNMTLDFGFSWIFMPSGYV